MEDGKIHKNTLSCHGKRRTRMFTNLSKALSVALFMIVIAGCRVTGPDAVKKSPSGEMLTPCPEPRPQICTQEYRPVCAQLSGGIFKTYATGYCMYRSKGYRPSRRFVTNTFIMASA